MGRILTQGGLIDGGLINEGHGMLNAGLIRAHVATPSGPGVTGYAFWVEGDVDVYQDSALTTPATADGDPAGGWKDQSGNSRHQLQPTSGTRPIYKTGGPNSKPYVRCTSADVASRFYDVTTFTVNQPLTVFMVARQAAWANTRIWTYGGSANLEMFTQSDAFAANPAVYLWAGGGTFIQLNTQFSLNTWRIVEVQLNGASSFVKVDNNANVTGTLGTTGLTGLRLGNSADVDFAEFIVYPSALSSGDSTTVRGYLNTKYTIF